MPSRHGHLRLTFIPGNHDLAVNTELGTNVRPRLRQLLSQTESTELFPTEFRDSRHSVFALHGHEWDSVNRSGGRGQPFGDVNVIEVLVRLPIRVAEKLQMNLRGTALDFLFEVDNVRPQTPGGMARWLELGLANACKANRDIERAFDEAFEEILDTLWTLGRTRQFELFRYSSRWERTIARALTQVVKIRGLHRLLRLFPLNDDAAGSYPDHLRALLSSSGEDPPQYVLCGHTHIPEHVPISMDRGRRSLYLNTGTWRRVHVPRDLDRPSQTPSFASHQSECVTVIFNADERRRGLPPYEFHRTLYGL